MASERQIAANRRNAQSSTGPRTKAGKKRASENALRHGLTSYATVRANEAERIEQLARRIAGDSNDLIVLDHARTAAAAELQLARVRDVKVAWISQAFSLGTLTPPELFRSPLDEAGWMVAQYLWNVGERRVEPRAPELINPLTTMPAEELERTAEAVRRALPQLRRIQRHEQSAAARRDRAIRKMSQHIRELTQLSLQGDARRIACDEPDGTKRA
jgi:hypothetical protein